MMNLYQLLGHVDSINNFQELDQFLLFASEYLQFIHNGGLQNDIVSTNEHHYHFFQYRQEADYCITRPINTQLFIPYSRFQEARDQFYFALDHIHDISEDAELRQNINRIIYTCQQSIGAALDAFNNPNKARKRNGLLFEILVRSVVSYLGINTSSGDEVIPFPDGTTSMKFEHDIILRNGFEEVKAIGQLKTSTKDRLDKIFLDKFMYNRLKETDVPHFAVILNDVQRKNSKNAGQYGINSTFLPGHFNAYRIALNPLDGVYYLDLRPSMKEDGLLCPYIKSFDSFLVSDIWSFLE